MTRDEQLALVGQITNTPERKQFFQVAILVMRTIGVEEFTTAINQKTPLERELAVYRLYFKHFVQFVEEEQFNECLVSD